jgi:NAD(P)-dependent dehydrogenase (short-subunit alcohol dehydrogenase family)
MQMESAVVLVTGASSGIGRAIANRLHRLGSRVYGTSRRAGVEAEWPMLQLDVRDDGTVQTLMPELLRREGRLDVLINNAGIAMVAGLEETTPNDLREQLEVNAVGPFRMICAALPVMRRQGRGRIINISSLSGLVPHPFLGAYSASKHALEALSETLHHELRGTGIHVTLVEPDGLRTHINFVHPESDNPHVASARRRLLRRLESATRETGQDPAVLVDEVIRLLGERTPPLRCVIGEGARRLIAARRENDDATFAEMIAREMDAAAGTRS